MPPEDDKDPNRLTDSNPNLDIAAILDAIHQIQSKGGVKVSVRDKVLVMVVSGALGIGGGGAAFTAFVNFFQQPALLQQSVENLEERIVSLEAELEAEKAKNKAQGKDITEMTRTVGETYEIVNLAHPATRVGVPRSQP